MKCVECEERKAVYSDPRDPPIEIGEALCGDCLVWVTRDMLDDNVRNLMEQIETALSVVSRKEAVYIIDQLKEFIRRKEL